MEQPVVLEGNLVKLGMEARKRSRLTRRTPRPLPKAGEHRLPVDPLENEAVVSNLEYLRDRKPVGTRVAHDGGLASRVTPAAEATKHTTVA
jgi:hypothetical protein